MIACNGPLMIHPNLVFWMTGACLCDWKRPLSIIDQNVPAPSKTSMEFGSLKPGSAKGIPSGIEMADLSKYCLGSSAMLSIT